MTRLADFVMRFIADQGVKHIFLVVGGGAMHLNDALAKCPDLEFVCNHHEQASAIAAEAYAKVTNNLGVVLVTTGPGGTNAITGLAGAWLDSTPCLFISGQVKRADSMYRPDGSRLGVRQRGIQEVDIVSIVRPLTKYAVTVTDPSSIRYHLEKAVYLAKNGRPGPVWIDIPIDVQAAPVDVGELKRLDESEISKVPQDAELRRDVSDIIERFNSARRPLLLIGNGVRLAHAECELDRLLPILNAPVETTWLSLDLVPQDHPLFVGRPGTVAPRYANFALQNCDFLLAIGARLDIPVTGYSSDQLARGAYRAMIDVDPAELQKHAGILHKAVCADAGDFLREMLAQHGSVYKKDRSSWLRRCSEWKQKYPLVTPQHRSPGRVSIYHFAEVLSELSASDECIVSGSSGSAIEIFLLAYPTRNGQRVVQTAGLGAMGFALPASIGTLLGGERKRVICVDGDGGFQLNIQELATVAQLALPIKFFVMDNEGYASIRASQTNFFGKPNIGCGDDTGLGMPDLCKVAEAYGLTTAAIEEQSNLRQLLEEVLQMPGPVLCNVKVIPDEIRAPRVTSVQHADGSFLSKPLEDLWPLIDRVEFEANMMVGKVRE